MKPEIKKMVTESKDVSVYKKLINALSYWSEKFPMTGVDSLYKAAIDKGKSILPKDKRALSILSYILSNNTYPAAVSALINTRFADLPVELKPIAVVDKRQELAFWNVDGRVTDLVKNLIDFEGGKSKGFFCDMEGKKVTLIDSEDAEQEITNKENTND